VRARLDRWIATLIAFRGGGNAKHQAAAAPQITATALPSTLPPLVSATSGSVVAEPAGAPRLAKITAEPAGTPRHASVTAEPAGAPRRSSVAAGPGRASAPQPIQESGAESDELSSVFKRGALGPFRFTSKQASDRCAWGGWEARCPFHRRSEKTGCKKFISVKGPKVDDKNNSLKALMMWCMAARSYDRQWKHVAFNPGATADLPPIDVLVVNPIFSETRPETVAATDIDLDRASALAGPAGTPRQTSVTAGPAGAPRQTSVTAGPPGAPRQQAAAGRRRVAAAPAPVPGASSSGSSSASGSGSGGSSSGSGGSSSSSSSSSSEGDSGSAGSNEKN